MERLTFKVLFFIRRKRLLKNGEAPILMRITVNGKRLEVSTCRNIEPGQWDGARMKSKGNSGPAYELNDYLKQKELRIYRIKRDLEERDQPVTVQAIKDSLYGNIKENAGILSIFEKHNEKCKARIGIDITKATVGRYETTKSHLREYIAAQYKQDEYPIRSINHGFVMGFEHFLKTQKKCCHNTTVKYIRNFNKIIRLALNNDWIKSDPLRNITYRLDPVDRPFLSDVELHLVRDKKLTNERISRVRDIFVFCCFTGLAFSDVKRLTCENLVSGIDGTWIRIQRQKTKQPSEVPLIDIPLAIIDRYKNHPVCQMQGSLLPVPSNQKMNAYLKEIGDLCGINKQLSTHTARHTFATTVTLAHGVPLEVVSTMLGHTDLSTTRIYARVLNTQVKTEMKKVHSVYGNPTTESQKTGVPSVKIQ